MLTPSLKHKCSIYQVNVGCVPKKVMFNTAMLAEHMHDHKDYGFTSELHSFDWR